MPAHTLQATLDRAEDAFRFLESHRFVRTDRSLQGGNSFRGGWRLKYESPKTQLTVEYSDVQLDVRFARRGLEVSYFTLDRVLHDRRSGFHGNMFTLEKLANVIERVASDVQQHDVPLLKGDDQAWADADTASKAPKPGPFFP